MTVEERKELLMNISEKTGDNEEVMDMLKQLQDDNDTGFQREDVYDGDETWKNKYEKLRKIYRDRFFNGDDKMVKTEYTMTETATDSEVDNENVSFESLFK